MQFPTFDNAQLAQLVVAAPIFVSAATADELRPGQFTVRANESGNTLVFIYKYSTGVVKSGTIALA